MANKSAWTTIELKGKSECGVVVDEPNHIDHYEAVTPGGRRLVVQETLSNTLKLWVDSTMYLLKMEPGKDYYQIRFKRGHQMAARVGRTKAQVYYR
jgi:hypothetical protein